MSLQTLHFDFSGQRRDIEGDVKMESNWDATRKGLIACAVVWLLAACSFIVPFIGWTAPFVLFALGPIAGLVTFFMDRHEVKQVETHAVCPECSTSFGITEKNFKPPFYGACPSCRMSYRVDL